jgi:hypothetical protein
MKGHRVSLCENRPKSLTKEAALTPALGLAVPMPPSARRRGAVALESLHQTPRPVHAGGWQEPLRQPEVDVLGASSGRRG